MWCLETIVQLNRATRFTEDHRTAAECTGVRVLGNVRRAVGQDSLEKRCAEEWAKCLFKFHADKEKIAEMSEPALYEPEIGQMLFGQPHQRFEVPLYVEAALRAISAELDRVMWNLHGEEYEYESPFANTGNRFECDTFKVHAYDWNEDHHQAWNFKWKDIEISWYKHYRRGASINREIGPAECAVMLFECHEAVTRLDPCH